jgi:hypothetical protein
MNVVGDGGRGRRKMFQAYTLVEVAEGKGWLVIEAVRENEWTEWMAEQT